MSESPEERVITGCRVLFFVCSNHPNERWDVNTDEYGLARCIACQFIGKNKEIERLTYLLKDIRRDLELITKEILTP